MDADCDRLASADPHATRRFFVVRVVSAERADSVSPMARTMRITVLNSGLPVSPSALYKLSRFKPAFFAISPMPRPRPPMPPPPPPQSPPPSPPPAPLNPPH